MTSAGLGFICRERQILLKSAGDLLSQLKKSKWLTAAKNRSAAKELSRKVNILLGDAVGRFTLLSINQPHYQHH